MATESGFYRFGALVWAALVLTTLANTLLPHSGPYLGLTSDELDFWRDAVLVPHGLLGLLASWVVTLALFRAAPGFAGAGFVFAFIEKGAEFVGQVLMIFTVWFDWRQRLAAASDEAARAALDAKISGFMEIWDDMFLVFWIGAVISNLLWTIAAGRLGPAGRLVQVAFFAMALLAAGLIAAGYAGQAWLNQPLMWLYPPLLAGSRLVIAAWLWRLERSQ